MGIQSGIKGVGASGGATGGATPWYGNEVPLASRHKSEPGSMMSTKFYCPSTAILKSLISSVDKPHLSANSCSLWIFSPCARKYVAIAFLCSEVSLP